MASKKKNKGKKKDDDWGESADDFKKVKSVPPKVALEESSDEEDVVVSSSKPVRSAFAAFADSDEDEPKTTKKDSSDDEKPEPEPAPKSKPPPPVVKESKKKDKKKGKQKDEEDEIDALLAQMDAKKSENKDKKKKKKGKGTEDAEPAQVVQETVRAEPAPMMESGEEDAEVAPSKSKKKKKGKKEELEETEAQPEAGDEDQPKEESPEKEDQDDDETGAKKKKKKKKKGKDDDEEKKDDKKPKKVNKQLEALKEALRLKEEQEKEMERLKEEEEKRYQEALRLQEEKEREDREKREQQKKLKEEKIAAEKAAGTYRTAAQIRRNQEALERLRISGNIVPEKKEPGTGEKKRILYTTKKKKEQKEPSPQEPSKEAEPGKSQTPESVTRGEASPEPLDDWEMANVEEIKEESKRTAEVKNQASVESESSEEESDESEEESESSSEESSEEEATSVEAIRTRFAKRKAAAEAKRSVDNLRSPVICVLGHVDTGKTKMLDTIRRTNVQGGEAGGITQQIGATRVPDEAIKERCKRVKDFNPDNMKIPGFLIIDTPGHESFANLRSRGSSLCDVAILVVDIMHGLEPQTIESLKLLVKRATPFVIALNKVDRLYGYESNPQKDIYQNLKLQPQNTQLEFQERYEKIVTEFAEQGLNVVRADQNQDLDEYISMVPTSAFLGDGIGNIMAYIVEYSQKRLAQRLSFSEELDCTVMEVRSLPGLGTTVDVILVNGTLARGDVIVVTGMEGAIVTEIRDLLMPAALREIRVKTDFEHYLSIKGAQGVKILAKGLEKAVAGLPLFVCQRNDELEILRRDAEEQLVKALMSIKKKAEGVYVQASTLGSLEALLEFLKSQKIPYSGVNIGPVHKKDVQKAAAMHEHNDEFACILAFDVPVDREVQQFADREKVRIFQANIIYHLEDSFLKYREELRLARRMEHEHLAIFPCKLQIMPQNVFNARNPIICGVQIVAGQLKKGTPICVPSKENLLLGTVASIEKNHENVDLAKAGDEVCVRIENTTGEAPRLYGRHFTHQDMLVSRITRESINVCKDFFRDDLSKADWQLVVQLKKLLGIL
ncbi:hypothetical protein FO519_006294 [Halicephalobus sp. NKZ332]|nr:hypothetical protein FO519_006294 [Halicephalobus sp. NKZ332]